MMFICVKSCLTNVSMTLRLFLLTFVKKYHFGAFSVFHTKYSVILNKKQQNSKMVHPRKISTTEVKSNKNKKFLLLKVASDFDFNHFLEK